MLSKSAFNSMLKTLEEPPAHVKFVLATTDPQKIPVTVLSRCLQFNLKPMPPSLVAAHLAEVLAAERIDAEPAALQQLARAAAGSMRDALSLTDQAIAYGSGKIEAAAVDAMLGTVRRDYLFDLLEALAAHDGDALLDQARSLAERGIALDAALQDMASVLTQLALLHGAPAALAPDTPDLAQLQSLVAKIDAESVQLYYQIALNGRRDMPYAPDELAGFSMTLLRMLAFAPGAPSTVAHQSPPAAPQRVAPNTPDAPQGAAPVKPNGVPRQDSEARSASEAQSVPVPQSAQADASLAPDVVTSYAAPAVPQAHGVAESQPTGAWDWLDIVSKLKLGGMAKMLADHCELVSHDGDAVLLRVGQAHKHCSTAPIRTSSSPPCASAMARAYRSSSKSAQPRPKRRSRCARVRAMRVRPRPSPRSRPIRSCASWSSPSMQKSSNPPFNPLTNKPGEAQ
jgi:DNA polymerase III, gamma/tau subunits